MLHLPSLLFPISHSPQSYISTNKQTLPPTQLEPPTSELPAKHGFLSTLAECCKKFKFLYTIRSQQDSTKAFLNPWGFNQLRASNHE